MGKWVPIVATLDHPQIVTDYKSGMAVTDIALKHGARDYHIRNVLKKAGITIIKGRFKASHSPHNKSDVLDSDILLLIQNNHTFKEAAEKLDCSIHIIRQRCYKLGIMSPGFSFIEATNLRVQVGDYAYEKLSDKIWLFDQYIIRHKPSRIIASELGCGKKAILSALVRHRIAVRKGPQNRGRFVSKSDRCHEFWCDSYWEWKIACRLDDDLLVLKFIKNPFPISYIDNDGQFRKYIPDFLVILKDGSLFLIEIKPDGLLPYVELKTQAGLNLGFKYTIMNVDDAFPWEHNYDKQ